MSRKILAITLLRILMLFNQAQYPRGISLPICFNDAIIKIIVVITTNFEGLRDMDILLALWT